jgi:hypothetical protein
MFFCAAKVMDTKSVNSGLSRKLRKTKLQKERKKKPDSTHSVRHPPVLSGKVIKRYTILYQNKH